MESRSLSNSSKEFQLLTKEINTLQKEITYQTNIRKYNTIPLKFLPRHYPTTPDNSLTNKFKQELKDIFWKHLDKTIRSNIVTLEIKKARLQDLLNATIQTQCSTTPNTTPYAHPAPTNTIPRKRKGPNTPSNSPKHPNTDDCFLDYSLAQQTTI